MSISVMAMGRMKEKPYRQMADEYLKRLSRYGKFEEIELPVCPNPRTHPKPSSGRFATKRAR